jgi:hypothetical protein
MTHSLIGADRGTHGKITGVALAAAIIAVLAGTHASGLAAKSATAASVEIPLIKAGEPVLAAAAPATITR